MKFSKIALATSMALAAMSSQAATTGIPSSPANVMFMTGASGVDSYMGNAIPSLINVTTYVHSANSKAWYGTTKAEWNGLAAGSEILLIKRSAGGSAVGVFPLATRSKTNAPLWTTGTLDTGKTNEYTVSDSTDANGLVPDLGVSDVEPAMFKGINLENGYSALTSTQIGTLTASSWAGLAQGIVATKAVADTTVLSNNFIREALSGHYKTWAKADGSSDAMIICRRIGGSGTQAAYNNYFNSFPATQAFNGYSYNTPAVVTDSFGYGSAAAGVKLGTGNGSSAANAIGIDPSQGFTVFEGDASTDVRKCLQAAQLKQDVVLKGYKARYYNLAFSKLTNSGKALGVLSLDSYTNVGLPQANRTTSLGLIDGKGVASSNSDVNGEFTYRFLNGNGTYDVTSQSVTSSTQSGFAPSRANILSGDYDFMVEPTMQWNNASIAGVPNTKTWIKTASSTTGFFDRLISILGNPVDMEIGNANNLSPLAYGALPTLYTKTNDSASTRLVLDLTHQGNTTAPLHVKQ